MGLFVNMKLKFAVGIATIFFGTLISFLPKVVLAEVGGTVANPDMILIPGGTFTRGSSENDIQWVAENFFSASLEWYRDETPAHKADLKAFYIDRYEVANAEFLKFREAVPGREPKFMDNTRFNNLRHPVVGISWQEAVDYCSWAEKTASYRSGMGKSGAWNRCPSLSLGKRSGQNQKQCPWFGG